MSKESLSGPVLGFRSSDIIVFAYHVHHKEDKSKLNFTWISREGAFARNIKYHDGNQFRSNKQQTPVDVINKLE